MDWLTPQVVTSVIVNLVVVHIILVMVAYLVQAERKFSAYIQDRIGPNRTGFDFGLPALKFLKGCLGFGQPLADGIKFMLKEDFTPSRVDKVLFSLAPVIVVSPALIGFVVIPWGGSWDGVLPWFSGDLSLTGGTAVRITGADVNIGIVYILAVAALGVYGVTLGGWASNNKYSFLGGLRASAQMISYEIPLGLALLAALLAYGTVLPESIIRLQISEGWGVVAQPLAALIFFIAIMAEGNRAPFDNAEAEQELVGGYHTEYSSMRFALYFLAEYAHIVTSSAFLVLLFFGGYHVPFIPGLKDLTSPDAVSVWAVLAKFGVYFGKVLLSVTLMIVIRWTIPRLRYDQVMSMAWQFVIPVALVLVVGVSLVIYAGQATTWNLLMVNGLVMAMTLIAAPLIPKSTMNRKLPLYGSRFSPMPDERVRTQSSESLALEDRPVEGSAPVAR
ncbi:MAG: NADH-quinone oxidoreductase subunit H [Phycisphaerae bacterium]|nr:MAG: NADH-quinone oxidoreductase subunit H [Phycisphaerae bacterium]